MQLGILKAARSFKSSHIVSTATTTCLTFVVSWLQPCTWVNPRFLQGLSTHHACMCQCHLSPPACATATQPNLAIGRARAMDRRRSCKRQARPVVVSGGSPAGVHQAFSCHSPGRPLPGVPGQLVHRLLFLISSLSQ